MKRICIISDMHCGHRAGITPFQWQTKADENVPQQAKWAAIQKLMWGWFTKKVKEIGPIDLLIVNGDCIDGKGSKSEGTELIVSDRTVQAEMAFQTIASVQAKEIRMIRGTSYHVGPGEDFEDIVADKLNCKIGDHEWFDINGIIFDCKHFVPGSTMPHTKNTGLLGDVLWNTIWAENDESQPRSDIYIRSHLHSHTACMGIRPDQWAFVTPALQGMGSKYGARQCRKVINIGFMVFDVYGKGKDTPWIWKTYLMNLRSQAPLAEKL